MGRLSDGDVLGGIVNRFLSPQINLSPDPVLNSDGTMRLPGLDNHAMGTIFEDLVRRFNEENNEEAGEHWTPRDAVELMAQLVFQPIRDRIESGTYLLYDGAIGTGGMLTIAEQTLQGISGEKGKPVSITTTLSTQQSDMAREHGEMLERYGFSLTPGENGQWTILTMPAVMVNRAGSPEEMLANLLDELEFQTVTTNTSPSPGRRRVWTSSSQLRSFTWCRLFSTLQWLRNPRSSSFGPHRRELRLVSRYQRSRLTSPVAMSTASFSTIAPCLAPGKPNSSRI